MMCAWESLLGILPQWMHDEVDNLGRYSMQELRMRINSPPELVLKNESRWLSQCCCRNDISYVIQASSHYSPWARQSLQEGYLTISGGHRLGVCGLTMYHAGHITGLRDITSICVRVARDYPGIAEYAPQEGSTLILGAPGWGKTTLLRDLIRIRSRQKQVAVVDERGELFPEGFLCGLRMDILRGCRKGQGIEQMLKSMGPACIALDEITSQEDCLGMVQAVGCGVELLATAHAGSLEEFSSRPVYRQLIEKNVFQWVLIMNCNKGYKVERMST